MILSWRQRLTKLINSFSLILILLTSCSHNNLKASKASFRQARLDYSQRNYAQSLSELKKFINLNLNDQKLFDQHQTQLLQAINWMGEILLIHLENSEQLIENFNLYQNISLENDDAFKETLDEWLSVVSERKSFALEKPKAYDENKLLKEAMKYYQLGVSKQNYRTDPQGHAYLSVAEQYLMYFIIKHDQHPQIATALLTMGQIKSRKLDPQSRWSENFYFKEVIRRFPHSNYSLNAYQHMHEDIIQSFGGEDNLPSSIIQMLRFYKQIAE